MARRSQLRSRSTARSAPSSSCPAVATCRSFVLVSLPPLRQQEEKLTHSPPHSLGFNNLGPEGGAAVAEALKFNTTVTTIECGTGRTSTAFSPLALCFHRGNTATLPHAICSPQPGILAGLRRRRSGRRGAQGQQDGHHHQVRIPTCFDNRAGTASHSVATVILNSTCAWHIAA